MRLIDADELYERIGRIMIPSNCVMVAYEIKKNIDDATTIDALPVVHGRWVDNMCRDWRCSGCGERIHKVRNVDGYCYDDKPNYCPNCGARMDGEQE